MFIPNNICYIRKSLDGYNEYGEKKYGPKLKIRYGLINLNLKIQDTAVRADATASRSTAESFRANSKILVKPNVEPSYDDLIIINNHVYRIIEVEPRYAIPGNLDHYELDLEKTVDNYGDEI